MPLPCETPSRNADAILRSRLYKLLSLGLRYPREDMFEAIRSGAFHAELEDLFSQVSHLESLAIGWTEQVETLQRNLRQAVYPDFEVQYVQTFDVGAPQPPCPLYEYAYREGQEHATVMARLATFYGHFGLAMNETEGKRELHDHASVELELMHFLTFKEAQATEEGSEDLVACYRLAQRDFLARHLAQWLPALAQRLDAAGAPAFYAQLAKLAARAAALESGWLDEEDSASGRTAATCLGRDMQFACS